MVCQCLSYCCTCTVSYYGQFEKDKVWCCYKDQAFHPRQLRCGVKDISQKAVSLGSQMHQTQASFHHFIVQPTKRCKKKCSWGVCLLDPLFSYSFAGSYPWRIPETERGSGCFITFHSLTCQFNLDSLFDSELMLPQNGDHSTCGSRTKSPRRRWHSKGKCWGAK